MTLDQELGPESLAVCLSNDCHGDFVERVTVSSLMLSTKD